METNDSFDILISKWSQDTLSNFPEPNKASFKNMQIYPSPTKGSFSLNLGANYANVSIVITDLTGKQVYSKKVNNSKIVELSLNEPAGIYLLSVFSDENKATIKLMKE